MAYVTPKHRLRADMSNATAVEDIDDRFGEFAADVDDALWEVDSGPLNQRPVIDATHPGNGARAYLRADPDGRRWLDVDVVSGWLSLPLGRAAELGQDAAFAALTAASAAISGAASVSGDATLDGRARLAHPVMPAGTLPAGAVPGSMGFLYVAAWRRNYLLRRTSNGYSSNGVDFPWELVGGNPHTLVTGAAQGAGVGSTVVTDTLPIPLTGYFDVEAYAEGTGADGAGTVATLQIQRGGSGSDLYSGTQTTAAGYGPFGRRLLLKDVQLNAGDGLYMVMRLTQGALGMGHRFIRITPTYVAA